MYDFPIARGIYFAVNELRKLEKKIPRDLLILDWFDKLH